MKSSYRYRNPFSSTYKQNAVLHLIIFSAVCYIILHILAVVLMIFYPEVANKIVNAKIVPYIGLSNYEHVIKQPWVVFTYFLTNVSFWGLATNMLWLYCFGSVIQSLIGHYEIIPLYFISSILAAILYVALSYFTPLSFTNFFIVNTQVGVMALATAAIILAPTYRYFLGEHIAIRLVWMYVIFIVFSLPNFIQYNWAASIIPLLGGFFGMTYILFMKRGFKPGAWIYHKLASLESKVTPNERVYIDKKNSAREETLRNIRTAQKKATDIDIILDKINAKGYNSLNDEEKERLMKASQE